MWSDGEDSREKNIQKRKYERTIHGWKENKNKKSLEVLQSELTVDLTPQKKKYRRAIHNKNAKCNKLTPKKRNHSNLNQCSSNPISDCELGSDSVSISEFESDNENESKTDSELDSDDDSEIETNTDSELESDTDREFDSENDFSNVSQEENESESDASVHSESSQKNYCSDTPLYEGCKLNEKSSCTMIMLYVMKHSLSTEAFNDLLHLISCHLPDSATFPKTVYRVKESLKKAMDYQEPVKHFFCEICQQYSSSDNVCNKENCKSRNAKMLEFYDLKPEQQLKRLFKDDMFVTSIENRMSEADITKGQVYKDTKEQHQHGADIYLTFTLNTDGVSLFSSSIKGSLWPVYLAVNELPVRLRFSRKYLIVCYLHCQVEKPNMLTFLTPLMSTLEMLSSTGMIVDSQNGKLRVKGHLTAASLDLPARAMVANMKQFNGKHACTVCLDAGEYPEGAPLLRFYPYKENSILRTHQSMVNDAEEALRTRKPVNGIKGASPLMALSYVDFPKLFVIDWMHNVLLGVTKALLNFWLNNSHKNSSFYVGNKIDLMNQRLLRIQIPDFISRRQRSLHDHSHWKASECREWLIHFSVPVLLGVLSTNVLLHYMLLTTAMSLLTKNDLAEDDISFAEDLLKGFCEVYPRIYGQHKQTMNVHLLRHIAQFTRLHGPLFHYSCFGFESMNSYLKRMVHGTRYVNNQVCFAVGMSKQIATMVKQLRDAAATDSSVKKLAKKLGSNIIVEEKLPNSESILGKLKVFKRTDKNYELLPEDVKIASPKSFSRLQKGDEVFFSKNNSATKTKNSFTITFEHHNEECFGQILSFFLVHNTKYAIVKVYETERISLDELEKASITDVTLKCYVDQPLCPYIRRVISHHEVCIIPVKKIISKCVFMEISPIMSFMSIPSNLLEHG